MYERSASVLEKYISQTMIYSSELKENYSYYKGLISLLENYQNASEKEITYDKEYKMVLSNVEDIQKKQKEISKYNVELENKRNRLFSDSIKPPEEIESYLLDIEKAVKENGEKLIEARTELISELKNVAEKKESLKEIQETIRQENRNFRKALREIQNSYKVISEEQVDWLDQSIKDYKKMEDEVIDIMLQNGEGEKVPFDENAIKSGAIFGIDIARKECEAYIFIYKQTSKLMDEISSNKVKLETRKRAFFVAESKIKFLEAEKEYLNHFLDNERLTAIHSEEEHTKAMKDAMEKFKYDVLKFDKLYDLLVKETRGRATKEDYDTLYDADHYRDVEDREAKFKRETKRLGINSVVSPDYWRSEGMRCVYDAFTKIISPVEEKRIENNEIKIETVERIPEIIKNDADEDVIEDTKIEEDFKDEEIAEIIKSTPDIEEPSINDDAQIFRDEYKYKDRIRRLLEQNNIENVMRDYKQLDKMNLTEKDEIDEETEAEDDEYSNSNLNKKDEYSSKFSDSYDKNILSNEEDDEEDYDYDDEDDDYYDDDEDDEQFSRHKDEYRKGRHSDDNQRSNIFSKLKNIFAKSDDDYDYDYDDEEDDDDYEEDDDDYEEDDDDYDDYEDEDIKIEQNARNKRRYENDDFPRKTRQKRF